MKKLVLPPFVLVERDLVAARSHYNTLAPHISSREQSRLFGRLIAHTTQYFDLLRIIQDHIGEGSDPNVELMTFLEKREQDTYSCGLLVRDLRLFLEARKLKIPEVENVVDHYDKITKDAPVGDVEWDFVMSAGDYRILRAAACLKTDGTLDIQVLKSRRDANLGSGFKVELTPGNMRILDPNTESSAIALPVSAAFDEGYRGFQSGIYIEHNPYFCTADGDPKAHAEWIAGWEQAKKAQGMVV